MRSCTTHGRWGGEEQAITVTWCPLCGSAVVYDRTLTRRIVEFGVSGKLADDDLVMYDRQTESEWKQSTGVCMNGELAGETLSPLPAAMISWESFQCEYTDGEVLQPDFTPSEAASDDEPAPIEYDRNPSETHLSSDAIGLDGHRGTNESRTWQRTDPSERSRPRDRAY